jgi:adenylate cyclase
MTIRLKILALAFSILVIFGIVVTVSAVLQFKMIGELKLFFDYLVPIRTHAASLDVLTDEYELIPLRLLRRSNVPREEIEIESAQALKDADSIKGDFRELNTLLSAALADDGLSRQTREVYSGLKEDIHFAERHLDPFLTTGERVLKAVAEGHRDEAVALSSGFRETETAFGEDTAAMRQKLAQLAAFRGASMFSEQQTMGLLSIALFVLAALLGIVAGSLVASDIVSGLRRLIEGAKAVEAGELTVTLPSGGVDEIGQLQAAFNRMVEQIRSKEKIKDVFGKFVDPRIVANLIKNETDAVDHAERQIVTVFFSDISGFTSISEQLTATATVNLLNHYFTAVADLVRVSGGIVDKYMGDGIMAFWAAPFSTGDAHAAAACLCALKQQEAIEALNTDLPNVVGLRRAAPSLCVRMGLASGEVVLGTIGSKVSKSFTVIGDAVNLAARLEGANKIYRTQIIIADETLRLTGEELETRELDLITVAGKSEPVRIHELLGPAGLLAPEQADLVKEFGNGLAAYRTQEWDGAERQFRRCLEIKPADGPSALYLERIAQLRKQATPADWDGVWHLTKK